MAATCARCRGPDPPLPLSGLCAECSKKRAAAKDNARLFNRKPVRNRRRTVRRTIPADMTVRTPDPADRSGGGLQYSKPTSTPKEN